MLSLLVAAGFVLFAVDDFSRASAQSRDRIAGFEKTSPTAAGERTRESRNGKVREFVDDANDVLLRPFAGLSESASSRWVQRGVPALLGLLVYGFLLGYVARFAHGRGGRPAVTDTRRPASRSLSS